MTKEEKEELDKKIKVAGISSILTGGATLGLGELYDHRSKVDPRLTNHSGARKVKFIGAGSMAAGGALLGYRAYRHHKDRDKDQPPTN